MFCFPLLGVAQYGNKIKHRNDNGFVNKKARPQRQLVIGIGAANFLGELGGANQIGTYFVKDLEIKTTRPSVAIGYRKKFNQRFALKGGLYYMRVKGDDQLTTEPFRQNRNLNFRSDIVEGSIQAEVFFTKDKNGHLYRIKNAKGAKNYDFQGYIFGGVGAFFFNPQGYYNGKWYNLKPMSTEGEGMDGGPKNYSRFSVCIPYGIGVSEAVGKLWTIGLEIGIRKTFTDYIDDVSGNYYDNAAIKAEKGSVAAHFADPSIANYPESLGGNSTGYKQTAAGEQRGDPTHKDAYMFVNINVTYKLKNRHRVKSKF